MSEPSIHLTPAIALGLWRQALAHELGIKIPIARNDIEKIKAMMYKVRKEAEDPALESLMLCVAPGGEAVWLVKKTTDLS